MDEAVHAFLELDECAEVCQIPNDTALHRIDWILCLNAFPRVGFKLLEAERNLAALMIDIEDLRVDHLAERNNLRWMLDVLRPGHL